jgi:hypothetical protein
MPLHTTMEAFERGGRAPAKSIERIYGQLAAIDALALSVSSAIWVTGIELRGLEDEDEDEERAS